MATEREKMLAGELYVASDPELVLAADGRATSPGLQRTRATRSTTSAAADPRRAAGAVGEGVWIEPPFWCDYGRNIALGDRVYFNFNCVVLDCAAVTIGSDVFFGPSVQVYAATHPTDHAVRRSGLELARPIVVESDVWVGGGAILCPGVRIGARSVIGAGSVVTRDVPEGVVAAGNPCRVIRAL